MRGKCGRKKFRKSHLPRHLFFPSPTSVHKNAVPRFPHRYGVLFPFAYATIVLSTTLRLSPYPALRQRSPEVKYFLAFLREHGLMPVLLVFGVKE